MTDTIKMKCIRVYGDITRIDDEQRVVEGYAFVNETVPGEGGIRLTRKAMQDATPDYLKTGTIRSMHQPLAAGKPISVDWDEKGAYLRAKIVDDQEWKKVKEGVYKGFSIGVNPLTIRGLDVKSCEWWDSSLVDRGKDKDALFSLWHADGFDPDAEHDVVVIDEELVQRGSAPDLNQVVSDRNYSQKVANTIWTATDVLCDVMRQIATSDADNKEKLARKSIKQFADIVAPLIGTGTQPKIQDRVALADLLRVSDPKEKPTMSEKNAPPPAADAVTGDAVLIARLDSFEAKMTERIERMETNHAAALEAITRKADKKAKKSDAAIARLAAAAVPTARPVLFPDAASIQRNLDPGNPYGNQGAPALDAEKLLTEYHGLFAKGEAIDPNDPQAEYKKSAIVDQIQAMKPMLVMAGVEV